ncbi:MAG: class I SAM-dependent methyltransferase [Treponema sp.]|nr:class I SAM-dependent methyltransferase [Treponema sp.]MDY5758541.1 class I SAM-dependent methyltransferase [Treponema sp.]MDY5819672.1 class I SAM-dependent methyltransferase [Treponema sp.]
MTNIEKYYNKFHEEHRLTTRHGQVEFRTTLHYIEEAIRWLSDAERRIETDYDWKSVKNRADRVGLGLSTSPLKIADIGAGTGRYSVELCHRGYDVTAVELVKHNLEILRAKHENIKTWQGDARNLSFLDDKSFDITLLFGPLYHLHGDEEKLKALTEARRITKKGGIILVAYVMNEYSVISYCFKEHKWSEVAAKGGLSPDFHTICKEEDLYDYVRLEDIDRLNKAAGLERIKIISADGAADYMRRELNEMSPEEFEAFCSFQLAIAERPELVGAGSHCVDILKNV